MTDTTLLTFVAVICIFISFNECVYVCECVCVYIYICFHVCMSDVVYLNSDP